MITNMAALLLSSKVRLRDPAGQEPPAHADVMRPDIQAYASL